VAEPGRRHQDRGKADEGEARDEDVGRVSGDLTEGRGRGEHRRDHGDHQHPGHPQVPGLEGSRTKSACPGDQGQGRHAGNDVEIRASPVLRWLDIHPRRGTAAAGGA
jgi:hypothetical protein